MREIKFRAWNPLNKNMGGGISIQDYAQWAMGGDAKSWVFMQYTGLKDKNGVEIYEGDIVDLTDDNWWYAAGYGGFDSRIQKVEWYEPTTGFAPFAVYDSDCGVEQDAEKCVVIGNIYETPEQLKETNNGTIKS